MKKLMLIVLSLFLVACASPEEQAALTRQQLAEQKQKMIQEQKAFEQNAAQELRNFEQGFSFKSQVSTFIVLGLSVLITGAGLGGAIFLIQAGYYGGQTIKTRSQLIHSSANGQMPLVITRGLGYEIIRDPNLQIESTSYLQLPSPKEQVKSLLGQSIEFKPLEAPRISNENQIRVATQAQSVKLMIAAMSGADPRERKGLKKIAEDRMPEQLKAPMDAIITGEYRIPRKFISVDQTGSKELS